MPPTGWSLAAVEDAVDESAGLLVCVATCFEVCSATGLCCGAAVGDDPDSAVVAALAVPLDALPADPAEDVALALALGDALVHFGVGAGPVLLAAAGLLLAELLALAEAEVLGLAELVSLGLGLAEMVSLGVGVTDPVSLGLGVPLLWLPLEDTAGAVVTVVVACVAEPDAAAEAWADDDEHAVALPLGPMPAILLPDGETAPADI